MSQKIKKIFNFIYPITDYLLSFIILMACFLSSKTEETVLLNCLIFSLVASALLVLFFNITGVYKVEITDIGFSDTSRIAFYSILYALICFIVAGFIPGLPTHIESIFPFILAFIAGATVLGATRYVPRMINNGVVAKLSRNRCRTIVIGAGGAAKIIIEDAQRNPEGKNRIVAFVDDDPEKIGKTYSGLKIEGPISNIKNIKLCPCEGDAGTGMVATNSIKVNTGNVSAGTSDFAMIVTNKKLGVHPEIDMVTTPTGIPVAMVHCNNCTSDINAYINLFSEVLKLNGVKVDQGKLFTKLFNESLKGDKDAGGLTSFNYFSGEGVTKLDKGKPLMIREVDAKFNLANFMKMNILSSLATLKIGLDILTKDEKVKINNIYGHGGLFKTPKVAQEILSAAINAPVSVLSSAGEGGPYGMAILASYLINKGKRESLEDYLSKKVFKNAKVVTIKAKASDVNGFNKFLKRYQKYLALEKEAIK